MKKKILKFDILFIIFAIILMILAILYSSMNLIYIFLGMIMGILTVRITFDIQLKKIDSNDYFRYLRRTYKKKILIYTITFIVSILINNYTFISCVLFFLIYRFVYLNTFRKLLERSDFGIS